MTAVPAPLVGASELGMKQSGSGNGLPIRAFITIVEASAGLRVVHAAPWVARRREELEPSLAMARIEPAVSSF